MSARDIVFVVDDDPSLLRGLDRLLTAHGFQAEVFASTEDFQQRAGPEDALCLVLDIHLGDKSGIDFGRQLAVAGVRLPVIFITANDSEAIRRAASDVGCVAYLSKPFPGKLLIEAIEKARAQRLPD